MQFIIRWLATAVAVGAAVWLVPGIAVLGTTESWIAVAITGPIDIVADANRAFAVRNGSAFQGRITGSGCMLSAITGAYMARANGNAVEAALAAVVHMGAAGQAAQARMKEGDGTGSFHTYLMDALSLLEGDDLAKAALVEEVR